MESVLGPGGLDVRPFVNKKIIIIEKKAEIDNFSADVKSFYEKTNNEVYSIKITKDMNFKNYFISIFGLKQEMSKYSKMSFAFLGEKGSSAEIHLINIKLEEFLSKGAIIILENIEFLDVEIIYLLTNLSEKLSKSDWNGKLILIYSAQNINNNITKMITLLKSLGAELLILERVSLEYLKEKLFSLGYIIPDKLFNLLVDLGFKDYNSMIDALNVLEKNGFVVNKTYALTIVDSDLEKIKETLISYKSSEIALPNLSEEELLVILTLSIINEPVDPFDLVELTGLDEEKLIEILDKLIRKGILQEINDKITIKKVEFSELVKKMFSSLRLKIVNQKIGEYFYKKGVIDKAGIHYYMAGKYEIAYKLLKEAFNKAKETGNKDALLTYGKILLNIKDDDIEIGITYADTLKTYDKFRDAINVLENLRKYYPDNIEILLRLSELYYEINEYNKSFDLVKMMEKAEIDEKYKPLLYYLAALNLYIRNLFNESKEYIKKSEEYAIKYNNEVILSKLYRLLGNIYFDQNDFDKSLEYYQKALELAEKNNLYYDISSTYNNIGNIYSTQQARMDIALQYYKKALAIAEKNWYTSLLLTLYINLGTIYSYIGDMDLSLEYLRKSFSLSFLLDLYEPAFTSIINMSDILSKRAEIDEALKYFEDFKKFIDRVEITEIKYEFYILYDLFRLMKGETIGEDIKNYIEELKKSQHLYYVQFGFMSESTYYFYLEDLEKSINIFKDYYQKFIKNNVLSMISDMMEFIETILYYKFITGKYIDDEVRSLFSELEKYDLSMMGYFNYRYQILKSVIDVYDKKMPNAIMEFTDSISYFERENLKFLSAVSRLIFGLYMAYSLKDKLMLETAKKEFENIKYEGLKKPYKYGLNY
ncbi:MAG: tetratricopeptide repeat protein [Thermoplasmata archaeon]